MLRPWLNGHASYRAPSARGLLRRVARSPLRLRTLLDEHRLLMRLAARQGETTGLDIFTLVARRADGAPPPRKLVARIV